MSILTKFCVVIRTKLLKNSNNLFKEPFLMHATYFSCKINVVERSYWCVNRINFQWTYLGLIILFFMKLWVVMRPRNVEDHK